MLTDAAMDAMIRIGAIPPSCCSGFVTETTSFWSTRLPFFMTLSFGVLVSADPLQDRLVGFTE